MLSGGCVLVVVVTAEVGVFPSVTLEEEVEISEVTDGEGNTVVVMTLEDDDKIDEDDGVGVGEPEITEEKTNQYDVR